MILSTHALGGTVAALVFRSNPVLAFVAAFFSHFALDAIPHWDYPVRSLENARATGKPIRRLDRMLLGDIFRTAVDFFVGAGLSLILAAPGDPYTVFIVALGAIGGVLPDFLQLVYYIVKSGFILKIQRFHMWVHAHRSLKKYPAIGIPFQIAIAAALGWIIVLLR